MARDFYLVMIPSPSAPDMDTMTAPPAYDQINRSRSAYSLDINTVEEMGRRQCQKKARRRVKRTKLGAIALLMLAIILGIM